MIGSLRIVLSLVIFALATLICATGQFVALRTGLLDEYLMPRLWHRLILKLVGMRVRVKGHIHPDRPLLIASNHVSWTDIMVIGSVVDVHFIARGDVARWPVMGRLARLQRTIFVERERRRSSSLQAVEIAERLGLGDAVVLFAEGTTGDGNVVLPFKTSLFAAAGRGEQALEGLPVTVQPVAIAYVQANGIRFGRLERTRYAWIGDQSLLPHLFMLLRGKAIDVELSFGEPLSLDRTGSRKSLARVAESSVRAMLTESLRGPVPRD